MAELRPTHSSALWRTTAYALHNTWRYLVFFSTVLFACYADGVRDLAIESVFRTSVIALAMGLTACALLHRRVMQLLENRWFDYCGPMLIAAGILVLTPCLLDGRMPGTLPLLASAAGTGFGSAMVLLSLGRRFVGVDTHDCISNLLVAAAASAVLVLALCHLPLGAAVGVVIALPFLVVATLRRVPLASRDDNRESWSLGEKIGGKTLARFVVCGAVLGILTATMRNLYAASETGGYDAVYQLAATALLFALCLGVYFSVRRLGLSATLDTLYKPAVLICTVGFTLVPVMGNNLMIPNAVVSAGYSLFELMLWALLCEIATRFQYTSVQVFGLGRGIELTTGMVAGTMFASPVAPLAHDAQALAVVAAVSTILVVFLRTYVLSGESLVEFERSLDDMSIEVDGIKNQQVASPGGEAGAVSQHAVNRGKMAFLNKCAIIGEYYGLTKREVEVFRLLAAGRNSVRIQEELTISAGTVNTHSYHIFQKLGVHCQQEIIDLLEQADLDRMQREIAARG